MNVDDIKNWATVSHQGVNPSVSLPKTEFDWLIEQVEKQKEEIERYETALKFGIKYLQNSDSRQIQLVKNALKEALGDNV